MQRTINIPVAVIILLLSVVVTYQAVAHRQQARLAPPVVANVDLGAVLDGLSERADAEAELRTLADGIRTEQEGFETEITDLQGRLDAAVTRSVLRCGSPGTRVPSLGLAGSIRLSVRPYSPKPGQPHGSPQASWPG